MYSLAVQTSDGPGHISLEDLRAKAEEAGRPDLAVNLVRLQDRGCSYSNEDFDVMARTWAALGWPHDVVVQRPTLKRNLR